jgi:uncharacterized membrane protein
LQGTVRTGDSSAVTRGTALGSAWRVRAIGAAFGLGAGALVASVVLAATRPGTVGSIATRTVFARACHQDPARSFAWDGEPFCVCHRCFGIYAGLAVGALAVALFPRVPLDPGSRRLWLAALLPMLAHVALLHLWPPADLVVLRVGTGALFGLWGGVASSLALGQAATPASSRPRHASAEPLSTFSR